MLGKTLRIALGGVTAAVLVGAATASAGSLPADTRFAVRLPDQGAVRQVADLVRQRKLGDAALLGKMLATPQATWVTDASAARAKGRVQQAMALATAQRAVPVLVLYNIPFRDCAQFSAGGATNAAEYAAWVGAVAEGIGSRRAIVLLEPDSLGIIPWYNPFADRDTWVTNPNLEWCQPAEANPATAATDRFAMVHSAVTRLKQNAGTSVYLDGTHSGWLGSGDAADRMIQAGVADADGFFLNVSNFRLDAHLVKYGTWISKCIAFASNPASWGLGHSEWCASQYSPANPNDFSTWGLTDQWYTDNVESQTWWYSESLLDHFVIDTSRNGQGPWDASTSPHGPYSPDPQDWCNPPDRGLGVPPTADTGNALIDAYLWVKTPGESDGQCTRSLGPVGTVDPEWGLVDPAAGEWFPQQALQLAQLANPQLQP
jgi:endoglucanase